MAEDKKTELKIGASRHFTSWLGSHNLSIAISTYQANKLFLIGRKDDGAMSIFERTFQRPMGIAVSPDANTLVLATQYQIFRFDNVLPPGQKADDLYDRLYCPHNSWITGDLDIHDIGIDAEKTPSFVATRFSCIGEVSEGHSFRPLWQPPFISQLVAEDRCHLNGMATKNGKPAFATAASRSDTAEGWRDGRVSGGLLIDVETGAILLDGLSMPHSPRWHDGRLYLLNAGTGEFGWFDAEAGEFRPICFCPGYARGLSFHDGFAAIGISLPRENATFSGLPLEDGLRERDAEPRCGVLIVDIESGTIANWLRIEGIVTELFDVTFLPATACPSAIGFKSDEILHVISIDDGGTQRKADSVGRS
ncbi:TIGR03032 family protein [Parasphingopyxis marina]|uniref:TIGR03032 family protein n=1 Tax=Parasphingopyxis marina TaxID=2761622 RepID=A0A842HYG0_9SPHN|nr:TIGR03032 family protein [Parasphingopyxis marina]MBC2776534.1 TIGR03032 family protein [Parasphingopyxis marina]